MKISKNYLWIAIFAILLWGSSCNKNEVPVVEMPGNGEFIDHGFIPATVAAGNVASEFQSMIYNNGHVFVATTDGIWKNNLSNKQWTRSGLDGNVITAIYKHPEVENRFFAGVRSDNSATFKTLYISNDGGSSWNAATNPVYSNHSGRYEEYMCFAARPEHPDHIYANLDGGTTIAVSTDGGNIWARMNNMEYSYFGSHSNIVFQPNNPNAIFQGAEQPLDYAWLGRYEINHDDPVQLQNFTTIIDYTTWSNRRPNQIKAFAHSPGNLYIGQEGALSKVTGSTNQFIFKKDDGETPYSYIYGVWVNPANSKHILFGGGMSHIEQPMQLFETLDEGKTIHQFSEKFGLENPVVVDIVQTDKYPAILLNDRGVDKVKLVVYKSN
jgi:hypothetical protein